MVVKPEDWENCETYKGAIELSKAIRTGLDPFFTAIETLDAAAWAVRRSENVYNLGVNLAQLQIAMDKVVCVFNRLQELQTATEKHLGDDDKSIMEA